MFSDAFINFGVRGHERRARASLTGSDRYPRRPYTLAGFPRGPRRAPLRCRAGFKVYVLTSWCKWFHYPASAPSLPTASPSACNLCCEERQQRTTHKTFGKSAWFIFTRPSWTPNYTGVFSTRCFSPPLHVLFFSLGWKRSGELVCYPKWWLFTTLQLQLTFNLI